MSLTLEHLDPTSLVIADNVRLDPRLDKQFVASIRERGVLEPVVGHRDDTGTVVVEYGQRRTLAARQAGRDTIPVMVSDTASTTADRLVDQWVENEHRAPLTNRERVEAVRQMALEGLSLHQIAKRTATAKNAVQAAAAVATSGTATDAVDMLTLEQAAVIAEFEDDERAVQSLLDTAARGYGFDHTVQRLRDRRAEQDALAAAADTLRAEGVALVDQPGHNDSATKPLRELRSADGQPIDPAQHATDCPGHVTWLIIDTGLRYYGDENVYDDEDLDDEDLDDEDLDGEGPDGDEDGDEDVTVEETAGSGYQTQTVVGCTGWAGHGHHDAYAARSRSTPTKAADMSDDERETARAARRHVIQSNKDWAAATTVRRAWLRGFATRKTPPTGAEAYLAGVISDQRTQHVGAHDLLGTSRADVARDLATATPKRALHLALALAIASWEQSTTGDTWRQTYEEHVAVATLTALSEWGYELSDIEARIVAGTSRDVT